MTLKRMSDDELIFNSFEEPSHLSAEIVSCNPIDTDTLISLVSIGSLQNLVDAGIFSWHELLFHAVMRLSFFKSDEAPVKLIILRKCFSLREIIPCTCTVDWKSSYTFYLDTLESDQELGTSVWEYELFTCLYNRRSCVKLYYIVENLGKSGNHSPEECHKIASYILDPGPEFNLLSVRNGLTSTRDPELLIKADRWMELQKTPINVEKLCARLKEVHESKYAPVMKDKYPRMISLLLARKLLPLDSYEVLKEAWPELPSSWEWLVIGTLPIHLRAFVCGIPINLDTNEQWWKRFISNPELGSYSSYINSLIEERTRHERKMLSLYSINQGNEIDTLHHSVYDYHADIVIESSTINGTRYIFTPADYEYMISSKKHPWTAVRLPEKVLAVVKRMNEQCKEYTKHSLRELAEDPTLLFSLIR